MEIKKTYGKWCTIQGGKAKVLPAEIAEQFEKGVFDFKQFVVPASSAEDPLAFPAECAVVVPKKLKVKMMSAADKAKKHRK